MKIWHPISKIPKEGKQIVIIRTAEYNECFNVFESQWVTCEEHWYTCADIRKIKKWAYQDELEALGDVK